jgi:hypothetical protein
MEQSKRLEEVLTLGERLVEELDLGKSVDTLSKWMAHYIAELISDARNTTDADKQKIAQEKCCETILRLWDHRASLPGNAKPLANLEPILKTILDLQSKNDFWAAVARRRTEESDDPWCEFIKNSYCADRRMACIAILTAIAESHFDREKRWVAENKEALSKEEAEIINTLDRWLSSGQDWLTTSKNPSVGELAPAKRTAFILKELEQAVSQQQEALKRLKKKLTVGKHDSSAKTQRTK